jgi:hypothetical protein
MQEVVAQNCWAFDTQVGLMTLKNCCLIVTSVAFFMGFFTDSPIMQAAIATKQGFEASLRFCLTIKARLVVYDSDISLENRRKFDVVGVLRG